MPFVHAHRQVGRDAQTVDGFQDQVGHAAGQVVPVRGRPADLRVVRVVEEQAGDDPDHGLVVEWMPGGHVGS